MHHHDLDSTMLSSLGALKKGKAGSEDGVVAECIQALSPDQHCSLIGLLVDTMQGKAPAPHPVRAEPD